MIISYLYQIDYDYINVVLDVFSHSHLCHKKVVSLQQE